MEFFDSGATYSCMAREQAEKLAIIDALPEPLPFETAEQDVTLVITEAVRCDFHLNGYRFSDEFFVVPNLSERLIIGASTMQKWRFKLDFENEEVIIDPKVTKIRLLQVIDK